MQHIKREPVVEQPKFSLIAVSEAARKFRNKFLLESNRVYKVGRQNSNDIHLRSPLCSKIHCTLQTDDQEIIMKDQSLYGTRINSVNYKDSRCIMTAGDLIGFGCNTNTRHLKDKNDHKYFVYRLSLETGGAPSSEPIEILSDSDEDSSGNAFAGNLSVSDAIETDDEDCPSADEEDIKPDIHTLMRTVHLGVEIKKEIDWNCHEYDRGHQQSEPRIVNEIPYTVDDEDKLNEDIVVCEPPQKRIRQSQPIEFSNFINSDAETESESKNNDNEINDSVSEKVLESEYPEYPEYQMSDTTRKEKCKLNLRSRGQLLATDMLSSEKTLMKNMNQINAPLKGNIMSTGVKTPPHAQNPSTSTNIQNSMYSPDLECNEISIQDLNNEFISEITKWEWEWINEPRNENPLQYNSRMEVRPLGINFERLSSFQRPMKNLLLMELYSIVYSEFHRKPKSSQNTFTEVKSYYFDESVKRYIFKCFAQKVECRVADINPGDFTAVITTNHGKFMAFVTHANQQHDGWSFELQSAHVINNKKNLKFCQVVFLTNVQAMLEYFVSLYELRKSSLLEVFLTPSSQYLESSHLTDFSNIREFNKIVEKIYENSAISLIGCRKILLVNGGAGTGKTKFISSLLQKFKEENFQYSKSILVCGIKHELVDRMAAPFRKIKSIARFGKLSKMMSEVRTTIGVEDLKSSKLKEVHIVFSCLSSAVDLLHVGRKFDVCIVDDASLCSEAEILPLFRLDITTLLLVGDEKLQTSTTQNECCRQNGYSRSLFTRVIDSYKLMDSKQILYPTLYQQHRMLPDICLWPKKFFYENQMKVGPISRTKRSPFHPYTVFQVNQIEDIEITFLKHLLAFCMQKFDPKKLSCGVICGHPISKNEIESLIKENKQFTGVEVSGYDSFQGREKDVIIMIALKPTNGFELFSTKENLGIAMTRAKESLIFCGNFQHVTTVVDSMSSIWAALLEDAKRRKRFFDLNGTFDKLLVQKNLLM